MVTVVLVLSAYVLAGAVLLIFGLMFWKGGRNVARDLRELEETGVETTAELVWTAPLSRSGLSLRYEYTAADGLTALHETGDEANPLYKVGEKYPLVRLPRLGKTVRLGTLAAVRKDREDQERYARSGLRLIGAGAAVCALAVTGIILLPPPPYV